MQALLERIDRRIGSRALYALLLLATCIYVIAYLRNPHTPSGTGQGWWGWWDQGQYLKSARALANFDFKGNSHWYPLGYPVVGALFVKLLPQHPFLIPNLLCFLGIIALLFRIFTRLLSRLESILLIAFAMAQPLVLEHLVIPWSTIPTQFGTYLVIALLVMQRPERKEFLRAGLVGAAMVLFRPGDLLFLLPIFAASGLARRNPRSLWRDGIAVVAIVLLGATVLMVSNKLVFGRFWLTPYTAIVRDIGFGVGGMHLDALALLVDPKPLYGIDTPVLLARYPWLLITLPGLVVLGRRLGWRALGLPLSLLLTFFFYLSYRDFDASTAFKFSTVHYLLWMVPLCLLLAYLTLKTAWRTLRMRLFMPLVAAPLLLAGLVETKTTAVSASPQLRFRDSAVGTKKLLDSDRSTALVANFPQGNNIILTADFDRPQRLRVIQLYGWPDNHYTHPGLELDGRWLRPNAHYRAAFGNQGLMLVLRREQRVSRLAIKVHSAFRGPVGISELRFIRSSVGLGGLVARWLSPSPVVRAWHVGLADDVTGPWSACDISDGAADRAVVFDLPAGVGHRLRALELRSMGSPPGRWVACGGPSGVWHAALRSQGGEKPLTMADLRSGGRYRLQVADNGAFENGAPIELLGLDQAAQELFRVAVESGSRPKSRAPELAALGPQYHPGQRVRFDQEGGVFQHWYAAEKGFRWTRGGWAALRLDMGRWAAGTKVVLGLKTRFANGPQVAEVSINHTSIGVLRFSKKGCRRELTFDAKLLRVGPNIVLFDFPEARQPPNGDRRVLAVAVEEFCLRGP